MKHLTLIRPILVIRLLASSNYRIDNGGLPSCIQKIIPRNFGKVSSGQHFAHRLSYVFMKTLDYLTTVVIQRLHEENQSSGRYSRPRFDR